MRCGRPRKTVCNSNEKHVQRSALDKAIGLVANEVASDCFDGSSWQSPSPRLDDLENFVAPSDVLAACVHAVRAAQGEHNYNLRVLNPRVCYALEPGDDPQRFYVHNVLTCHRSGHLEGVEDAEEWHRLLSKQFESAWLFWWYWFYRRLISLMEMLPDGASLPLPESFLESPLILTKQSGQK